MTIPRGVPSSCKIAFLLLASVLSFVTAGFAAVKLPNVFSDHMVLQQGKAIQIWGWASPGESVEVRFNGASAVAAANRNGEWRVALAAMNAGGPHVLTVKGENEITFRDVLIGEVWLCSGQSNMEMGVTLCDGAEAALADANQPQIRLLMVPNRWLGFPQTNIDAKWRVCSAQALKDGGWGGFSAAAYYFGRRLQQDLNVPIGLIDATWGGTCIQSWTPPEGFAEVPVLKSEYELVKLGDPRTPERAARLETFLAETEAWLRAAHAAKKEQSVVAPMPTFPDELKPPGQLQAATALFNGMIHPLCPYSIAGAIWYQGESNLGDGSFYGDRMHALIRGWRKIWGQGEFPFYFVQIAPYNYGGRFESLPELWLGQARAMDLPNVGMAVVNDIGNLRDIHPRNKRDVGDRLARLALAKTYGSNHVEYSGPVFRSLGIEGNKLRIRFDRAEGLASRDGKPLSWFEVIDAVRGGFVSADAVIEGDSIVLSSAKAPQPVAMRFAWSMLAEPNLMNGAGLPASAFRAGKVPDRDALEMNIPESGEYRLVYDLDLMKVGKQINYDQDRSAEVGAFGRIAYFIELQPQNGPSQYVYVSMDAFTSDAKRIGVPTFESGAFFQQALTNLNVWSNVKGITVGQTRAGGNIEFWPSDYGMENAGRVPGASGQTYDFGDSATGKTSGYGSMQIHNSAERHTIFALNHWGEGKGADVGIGNSSGNNPDWTFARNLSNYRSARLRVLVK